MALDAALGRLGIKAGVCTSSTRPANPYSGQVIYETDTNRTLVYDNSAWLVVADNQVLSIDTTNGRVGIGTTSPSQSLDVSGNIKGDLLQAGSTYYGYPLSVEGSSGVNAVIANTAGKAFIGLRGSGTTANDKVGIGSDDGDGLELHAGDNPRLVIDSSGNVTMPYQPCFRAYHSADIAYSSLGNPIPFNFTEFNIGNNYSTSTYSFTAPIDGIYLASAYLHWRLDSAFLYQFLRFHVNGAAVGIEHMRSGLKDYDVFGGQSILKLNKNDSLNVHWGNSGIDAGYARGGPQFNSFEVYFLG